ncbi:sugar phosphate isomerase/epimerase family protein [Aquipuribacter sp. SD81]|uniref:sugar phosphate isomerase/epimerase family protein n=1 Tax=Aquipuribacter sp. SD81 TaxID=3127703 RepID=UPI003017ECD3
MTAASRDPGGSGGRLPLVGLATSSVYPDGAEVAFRAAAELGYDGVEVMVWSDPVSRDADALRRLSATYDVPILSIHAPTLLLTQGVWGRDNWARLVRTAEHAEALGADVVVVHPPFRWQRTYGRAFEEGIAALGEEHHCTFAVENMFPWRVGGRDVRAYAPGWDLLDHDYSHCTLDFSHAATARQDALQLLEDLGDRVVHVHLADGSGSLKDEHLVPGDGNQPVAEVLEKLAAGGWAGHVVAEINTRRDRDHRDVALQRTLDFARQHLGVAPADGR